MARRRPYFRYSNEELRALYFGSRWDRSTLREIEAELGHRRTPSARQLNREVSAQLLTLSGEVHSHGPGNSVPSAWNPQQPAPPRPYRPPPVPSPARTPDNDSSGVVFGLIVVVIVLVIALASRG